MAQTRWAARHLRAIPYPVSLKRSLPSLSQPDPLPLPLFSTFVTDSFVFRLVARRCSYPTLHHRTARRTLCSGYYIGEEEKRYSEAKARLLCAPCRSKFEALTAGQHHKMLPDQSSLLPLPRFTSALALALT